MIESNKELEKKLERKDLRLQEKEEELFQLIEKVFRLEEDCEKVRHLMRTDVYPFYMISLRNITIMQSNSQGCALENYAHYFL